jgi:hypothetical protein
MRLGTGLSRIEFALLAAPHVGQVMDCTFLRVGFLAFMVVDDAAILKRKMVNFAQNLRIVVAKSQYHSLTRMLSDPRFFTNHCLKDYQSFDRH